MFINSHSIDLSCILLKTSMGALGIVEIEGLRGSQVHIPEPVFRKMGMKLQPGASAMLHRLTLAAPRPRPPAEAS